MDSGSSFRVAGDEDITTDEVETIRALATSMALDIANGETRATLREGLGYLRDGYHPCRLASFVVSWLAGQGRRMQLHLGRKLF